MSNAAGFSDRPVGTPVIDCDRPGAEADCIDDEPPQPEFVEEIEETPTPEFESEVDDVPQLELDVDIEPPAPPAQS